MAFRRGARSTSNTSARRTVTNLPVCLRAVQTPIVLGVTSPASLAITATDVHDCSTSANGVASATTKRHPDRTSAPTPVKYTGEVDILHDKLLGRYYLCIPQDIKHVPAPDIQGRVCAIDPGIRKMATCYDVSGRTGVTHWGCDHSFRKFVWISRKVSRVQSRATDPRYNPPLSP